MRDEECARPTTQVKLQSFIDEEDSDEAAGKPKEKKSHKRRSSDKENESDDNEQIKPKERKTRKRKTNKSSKAVE